jgi:putative ABC transport system ATP-binding protein
MGLSGQLTALRLEVPQPDASPLRILDLPHLDFEAGSVIGISGPSGSGKTSLLHCLAGLMCPTSGSVLWNGLDIATMPATDCDRWRRDNVGLVFQDFQLIPELSVMDNIALPQFFSHWRLTDTQKAKLQSQGQQLGLNNLKQTAASLSRGEQQRVAVARALWHQPSLILADEPTASLDRDHADKVMHALLDHARHTRTTLIVTSHDPAVLALMDRVIALANGRIRNRVAS